VGLVREEKPVTVVIGQLLDEAEALLATRGHARTPA
jgi:hypothetical protein